MNAIKLDGEAADRITAENIKQHMALVRGNIKALKKRGKLPAHEQEDLVNDTCLLDSLVDVYRYFAGSK